MLNYFVLRFGTIFPKRVRDYILEKAPEKLKRKLAFRSSELHEQFNESAMVFCGGIENESLAFTIPSVRKYNRYGC